MSIHEFAAVLLFVFPPVLHLLHQSLSGELRVTSLISVCISFKLIPTEI